MSEEIKSCPFCGCSDVKVENELCVCMNCGGRAVRMAWDTRVDIAMQKDKEARKLKRFVLIKGIENWCDKERLLHPHTSKNFIDQRMEESVRCSVNGIMLKDDKELDEEIKYLITRAESGFRSLTGEKLAIHGEEVKK